MKKHKLSKQQFLELKAKKDSIKQCNNGNTKMAGAGEGVKIYPGKYSSFGMNDPLPMLMAMKMAMKMRRKK